MKKVVVLGSTGSIGVNTLDVISRFPERFSVVGLTAAKSADKLEEQVRRFSPKVVSLTDEEAAASLRKKLRSTKVEVLSGVEGAVRVASHPEGDVVVSGIVGAAGLLPTLAAVRAGRTVALANKETLVVAGELVCAEACRFHSKILPVDSEHSAIFQALEGQRRRDVKRIILTASGGPLFKMPISQKKAITPEEAVRHPTWKMGEKISIDSATLMNKGLEIIEARWLFGLTPEKIDVIIHRQSIVHSMVEFIDRSVIAQLGIPDMRCPISYALSYPERVELPLPSLDLERVGTLTFEKPDPKEFPALTVAYESLKAGGTTPAVLNAANEEGVYAFLRKEIGFLEMMTVVQKTLDAHVPSSPHSLDDFVLADQWARDKAKEVIKELGS
ncbi:MAG TPA: 1-deoxy-D-xylulose-5-phosphate reductoisomerase [Nitrospiria bacterium]|nr:1-deoxy-D-xylulose-5-phosphate reductoisomerase [Nitrospiria bacterium]